MRYILYLLTLSFIFTSCSSSRRSASKPEKKTTTSRKSNSKFIEHISSNPSTSTSKVKGSPLTGLPGYSYKNTGNVNIETVSPWLFKYAIALNVPIETLNNVALFHLIDDWEGTPYHMGGSSKAGIDCSGFSKMLEGEIFGQTVARTSREQYDQVKHVPVQEMQEGDLVFFGTSKGVSHVGVYLTNNKFVHASTSNGVMISDLNETYWYRRFKGAGRIAGN